MLDILSGVTVLYPGKHAEEVLREMLRMGPEELDEIKKIGVI
jgi:hypothetical protein